MFVHPDKGEFVGRAALEAAGEGDPTEPPRRLRTVVLGDHECQPIYGGEAVRQDGVVVGRLRSVAYGPTLSGRSDTYTVARRSRRGPR